MCNKFLPRSSALLLKDGEEEHFFCSEACRDRFLALKSRE
jgi:YHS domain-containing protein